MKALFGKVVSIKQQKTIIVEVERFYKHPIYERRIRRTRRYPIHAEGEYVLGQVVRFIPTRPISKLKRWKVLGESTDHGLQSTAKEKKAVVSRRKTVVKK